MNRTLYYSLWTLAGICICIAFYLLIKPAFIGSGFQNNDIITIDTALGLLFIASAAGFAAKKIREHDERQFFMTPKKKV
ncbi:MAG: hypothetical protein WCG87_10140 [Bacteroidota bacterium]